MLPCEIYLNYSITTAALQYNLMNTFVLMKLCMAAETKLVSRFITPTNLKNMASYLKV
jgi:hypothetical protein